MGVKSTESDFDSDASEQVPILDCPAMDVISYLTHRLLYFLRLLPGVRLVALANSLGSYNLSDRGDIDLLIVVAPGSLWLSRLLAVNFLKIINSRVTRRHSRNRFCLSFWCTTAALNFQSLQTADRPDLYLVFWLAGLLPLYNQNQTWEKFVSANAWLKNYLPNFVWPDRTIRLHSLNSLGGWYQKLWPAMFLNFLEKLAHTRGLNRWLKTIEPLTNKNTNVIVNEQMFKLHSNDRRELFWQKYKTKLQELDI